MEKLGHSELFFSDYRDYWYNRDFLDLMAKRWGLNRYSSMLDVGCGQCHWSRLLVPYLKAGAAVTGYDSDIKWAAGNEKIKQQFESASAQVSFVKGDAQDLPFENDSFDVVTCQTVLIHVENPLKALSEMKRVVKKNGIVICAEPNNLAGAVIKDSASKNDSLEEKLENLKYALLWEQGKINLKEGDNSFGDLLTGEMSKAGFTNIQSYISDKAIPLYPPYTNGEQIATIKSVELWEKEKATMIDIGRKYFEILGPEALKFYKDSNTKNVENKVLKLIKKHEYYSGGATIMYLVSGTK